MRYRMILLREDLVALALVLLFAASGCGDKSGPAPPKPPKLTSPRIAITSNRTGTGSIHLYDPTSGQVTRLSPAGIYDQQPAISPDGMRISFVSTAVSGQLLMTMAVDGSDRKACGTNTQLDASGPRWSPDSKHIAFTGVTKSTGARNVYTILVSGDSLRPLTSDDVSTALAWSPDGTRILYVHHEPPTGIGGSPTDYLRDVYPDGNGGRTLLGPLGIAIVGADYSADGLHLAVCYEGVPNVGYRLEVCDSDGNNRVVVAESTPRLEGLSPPSWSPDGALIVFSAHIGTGSDDLYTATPAPADPQPLLAGAPIDTQPAWGPKP